MTTMRTVSLYALGLALVAVVLLLPAPVASAASCSGNCQGPDCYGGCTINSTTCSVGCFHGNCVGTQAQCYEYGSADCTRWLKATCVKIADVEPGETEPDETEPRATTGNLEIRNTEWSVVSYDSYGHLPAEQAGFQVLATSNRSHAVTLVDELRTERRDGAVRAAVRRGVAVDLGAALQRRLAYSVAPGTACVRATLEMSAPRFDLSVPEGASVFVRATVDAGGHVVASELLHADRTAGAEAAMVEFLKQFGHLTRADGERGAFEAFVVLSAKTGGEASWIVSGSKLLF